VTDRIRSVTTIVTDLISEHAGDEPDPDQYQDRARNRRELLGVGLESILVPLVPDTPCMDEPTTRDVADAGNLRVLSRKELEDELL